jgi:hypothetical protein
MNEAQADRTERPLGERKDWDVAGAFVRMAGADVEGFKKRIADRAVEYCAAQHEHLSFDEIQAASADVEMQSLSADRLQHLKECHFCTELKDAITPAEVDRQDFLEILKQYEKVNVVTTGRGDRRTGARAWTPAFGIAATMIVAVLGAFFWYRSALHTVNLGEVEASANFDWAKANSDCKVDSRHAQGCDLLVAAAALTTVGKPVEARPVFLRALRDAGVHETTVANINEVLSTKPLADNTLRKLAVTAADAAMAQPKGAAPEKLLAAAKLNFEANRPLSGYERLGIYAMNVTTELETAREVQVAFVQPIREIREIGGMSKKSAQVGLPATDSTDAGDSSESAASTAAAAKK